MPSSKIKHGHVTWDGRLIIDVNRLYRSKGVQHTLSKISLELASQKASRAGGSHQETGKPSSS